MTSFMQLFLTQLGALYSCDCSKCGASIHTHEWAHVDHNERRDAMEAGTLMCDDCGGTADPATFCGPFTMYAGRFSAPGYMDCTDWHYGRNKRELVQELRACYGAEA